VARSSYVDPRVIDLYQQGKVADVGPGDEREQAEEQVLELLSEESA
jgi:DNA topoisomerase IB